MWKIKENIQKLIAMKTKMHVRYPFIELQFLVFEHNCHEVQLVREYAWKAGVDKLAIVGERRLEKPRNPKSCYWLWGVLSVGWNGDCKACCFGFDNTFSLGNISRQQSEEIWNDKSYRNLQSYLFKGSSLCSEFIGSCPFSSR